MAKQPRYPYPIPELIERLEAMQKEADEDDRSYGNLALLLKLCHATIENAHAIWQQNRFAEKGPNIPVYDALNYGLSRLVPLMIDCTACGWHELLTYVENPERYSWYDPDYDWPQLPPVAIPLDELEEMCDRPREGQ
jgi:hypothetical protein